MKTIILGPGRMGKDTAAEYLRDQHGLSFRSSSEACAEVLKPVLDTAIRTRISADAHFRHRHDHRELWKELISLYNAADPTALAKLITSQCDMYVGMRSMREYQASRHLFDLVLWVDASERVSYRDPTMEIEFDRSHMLLIDNNGHLSEMYSQLDQLIL